jgi:hypothetical protein
MHELPPPHSGRSGKEEKTSKTNVFNRRTNLEELTQREEARIFGGDSEQFAFSRGIFFDQSPVYGELKSGPQRAEVYVYGDRRCRAESRLLELLNVQWCDGFEGEVAKCFQQFLECTAVKIACAGGKVCLGILLNALCESTEIHPSRSVQTGCKRIENLTGSIKIPGAKGNPPATAFLPIGCIIDTIAPFEE